MVQLIITVLSIALAAVLVMVSVVYTPTWQRTANQTQSMVSLTMSKLESSFNVAVKNNNGVTPAPTTAADGGLMANFGNYLKFVPVAPVGYTWVYGQHAADASSYSSLAYFCLQPTATSTGATEGVYRGMVEAKDGYSATQVFINSAGCDQPANSAAPSSYPFKGYMTMYVTYTPGVY